MASVHELTTLVNSLDPTQEYAIALWSTNDVLDKAKEMQKRITKAEANAIVEKVDRKQDCSEGINWDTIEFYIRDTIENRLKFKKEATK